MLKVFPVRLRPLILGGVLGISLITSVYSQPDQRALGGLNTKVSRIVANGSIVGAQVIIGSLDDTFLNENYGVRSIVDGTSVDSDTQFCIGSCSKPIAAAVVLAILEDDLFLLDYSIDYWLPRFAALKLQNGEPSRPPSLIELLSHHGGIYSQKKGMSPRQAGLIRNFKLTLEESVDGISQEPLYAPPGNEYAYSGAGYCVAGRVMEIDTDESFDRLLQRFLCEKIGMVHTSYFPSKENSNIAIGAQGGAIASSTPHLSEPFNLPLIGGSLYSTARDSSRFLRALLRQVSSAEEILMTTQSLEVYLKPFSDRASYGLGWTVAMENDKPKRVSHSGALASSRALFVVNLEAEVFGVVLYTLSDPASSSVVVREVSQAVHSVVFPKS